MNEFRICPSGRSVPSAESVGSSSPHIERRSATMVGNRITFAVRDRDRETAAFASTAIRLQIEIGPKSAEAREAAKQTVCPV
jgi:hypothetical protein